MESNSPILIIGMHRSGTSMITKLLGDNGLFLGDSNLLQGVNQDYISDNPKGYWEFKPGVELADRILTKLGGTWNRPPENIGSFVFEKEEFKEEIARAKEIFSPFKAVEIPWGWKDPRNSLLIDFWKLIFPDLKLLICLRNPIEVAFSLSKRFIEHVTFRDGVRLWELYNRVIVQKMNQHPFLVTHYESYFYSPKKEIERVREFIGLEKANNPDLNSIDAKLYRGMVPENLSMGEVFPTEIKHLYETMCDFAGEVYKRLSKDLDYQRDKNKTSSVHLVTSTANTFDEFFGKLNEQRGINSDLVGQIEILSNDFNKEKQILLNDFNKETQRLLNEFDLEKQRLLDDINDLVRNQEIITAEQQKIREENFQFGVELNQIKNSRSWKLISKLRPIYGKVYWSFARIFKFGYRGEEIHQDPISSWIQKRLASPEELEKQRMAVSSFGEQPLFSFITPVYNPPIEIFKELIQSIFDQTYSNWEVCLADGGDDPMISKMIQRLSEQDPRIKFIKLDQNYGISGNSNRALEMAEGEFIVICDHDDLVEPNLLFEAVKLINEQPATDMIYYDEDKLDVLGNHFSPFLKPATIAPELLISINYLTHSIIRRKLIEEIGGFNPETDGAQDWDLFLKVIEKTQNIYHIDKVLYHWRSVDSSAASGDHIKPYALTAQKLAIEGHLEREGLLDAEYKIRNHVRRVSWSFQEEKVSIIVPAVDVPMSLIDLEKFQDELDYPDYEILLVGNKIDSSLRDSDKSKNVSIHKKDLTTPVEAYNIGAELAQGKYILIGHPKMVPGDPQSISEMVMWMQKPGIGIVGSKLINRSTKKIKSFGRVFGLGGFIGDMFRGMDIDSHTFFGSTMNYYNVQAVASTGFLTERGSFLEYGGFSQDLHEEFAAINYCLKILDSGRRIIVNPFASFFVAPALRKISHEDILKAFSLVEQSERLKLNFYNNNLSYLHFHPTLSETRTDYYDLDIETILRRHYQSRRNVIG